MANKKIHQLPAGSILNTDLVPVSNPSTGALKKVLASTLKHYATPFEFSAIGNGSTNDLSALQAAITACISTGQAIGIVTGNFLISDDLTIPSNVRLTMLGSGKITVAADKTLTINGKFKSYDNYSQYFDGPGSVVFGHKSTNHISCGWFGAVQDSDGTTGNGTDNTVAIQKAIDSAKFVNKLKLSGNIDGTYHRVTSTLLIKSISGAALNFEFYGDGQGENGKTSGIFADFTTGPCINYVGARHAMPRGIKFAGRNIAPTTVWNTPATYAANTIKDEATFITPGLSSGATTAYCAIATDYGATSDLSADLVIKDCEFKNFVVGLNISGGGHAQGDMVRAVNCIFIGNTYGISLGNSQNRSCTFTNTEIRQGYRAFTNTRFGDAGSQAGSTFNVIGGQFMQLYDLGSISASNRGNNAISGIYCEAIARVIDCGSTSNTNNHPITFSACDFSMGADNGNPIYREFYNLSSNVNLLFTGCNFTDYERDFFSAYTAGSNSIITFENCFWGGLIERLNFIGTASVRNSYIISSNSAVNYNEHVIQTDAVNRLDITANGVTISPVQKVGESSQLKGTYSKTISRRVPSPYILLPVTAGAETGTTLEFTHAFPEGDNIIVGDILGTTIGNSNTSYYNPVLKVTAVNYGTNIITCDKLTDEVDGSLVDYIVIYTNQFITKLAITGSITNGSASVTGVTNVSQLAEGDWIAFENADAVYRIKTIASTTLTLCTVVATSTDGTTAIYNTLLT